MLSAKELDQQSEIKIDRWVDFASDEWDLLDDNVAFTKKILKLNILVTDSLGRLWGKSKEKYYPFHIEYGGLKIGCRMAACAAN